MSQELVKTTDLSPKPFIYKQRGWRYLTGQVGNKTGALVMVDKSTDKDTITEGVSALKNVTRI